MAILHFWLNSFIPVSVGGYTRTLSAGPHAGKTAIPLPAAARAWPGNWLKDRDCGYLTDQRTFSQTRGASSRMTSEFDFDISTMVMTSQAHTTSGTTEVNLVSGAQTGFANADMSRCSFTPSPFVVPTAGPPMRRTAAIRLFAAAGDPLVGMAADIDYSAWIAVTVSYASVEVDFNGHLDNFPAYECYASLGTLTKVLFTAPPPTGNTVVDLLGSATRPFQHKVSFP